MSAVFFDKRISFYLKDEEAKALDNILNAKRGKYWNKSHFIRCALIRLLREETKDLEKNQFEVL